MNGNTVRGMKSDQILYVTFGQEGSKSFKYTHTHTHTHTYMRERER